MPLITREELGLVLDEDFSQPRFDALYKIGLRVVRQAYKGDPEAADDETSEVIAGVLFGVIARIVANPKGARQLMAAGAGLTFGGTDADIASIFTLTDDERDALDAVSPSRGATGSAAFTIRPY